MASLTQSTERFRSAADFPKTVDHLSLSDASQLYVEMRDCLIFTNRSRSQLLRSSEEHEQTIVALRNDVARLQQLIHHVAQEKQALAQNQRTVIAALEQEMATMSSHLDRISEAFRDVEDIGSPMEAVAVPNHFNRLWRASRDLVTWWREESYEVGKDVRALLSSSSLHSNEARQEKTQIYPDPASGQRLVENAGDLPEGTWVLATSVRPDNIDLESQGISKEQAKILRESLAAFSDDWDSPEMSIYDNYDAAKANR